MNSVFQIDCHLSKLLEKSSAMGTLRARNPGVGLVKRREMKKELSLLLENTYRSRGLNSYFIIIKRANIKELSPAKTVPESDSNK